MNNIQWMVPKYGWRCWGKVECKREECIKVGGGESVTRRIVGASIGSSAASFVTGIPYIGWVAAGWLAMFGQIKVEKLVLKWQQ